MNCLMKDYGFNQDQEDHTLFSFKRYDNYSTWLLVYIDDMIGIRSNTREIEKLLSSLAKKFEIKDLKI